MNLRTTLLSFSLAPLVVTAVALPMWADAPISTTLSRDGRALQSVVVSEKAEKGVKDAAATLSQYLGRMSGGEFVVQAGDGSQGLVIGTAADFPNFATEFSPGDPTRREDYILRSHAGGVYLIGATPQAVRHAVWDFLHRLGYRQFFPGETWEIVPKTPNLNIAVAVTEHPDYYARRLFYGFGYFPGDATRYEQWSERNRATSGLQLNTQHAYTGIINAHKAEFEAHPEYRARPGGTKFVVSNEGLRKLVTDYALAYFEKNPKADSISMEPSDLGGWDSESNPDAKVFKNVSDRVVTLANTVAKAVNQKYPGKYVGIYAYSFHAAPPTIKVHPRVVVSVATALIQGHTVDELVTGWSARGATLGMREYYSINQWDRDLPARARAANLEYLKKTIPKFHAAGARFMSAEASDNWGPNGLGYYVASRLMWDVDQAGKVDEIVDDFLDKSFGATREPMARFYGILSGGSSTLFSEELVGQMYRLLHEARGLAADDATRRRIDDLVLYVRYLEMFRAYQAAKGPERQTAFEQMLRYVYRIHSTGMVYSLALYRDIDRRDEAVTMPKEAGWLVSEKTNPWKSSEPISAPEIAGFLKDGIANNKVIDFVTPAYSTDLVPAAPLKLTVPENTKRKAPFNYVRSTRRFYTWFEQPGKIELRLKSGILGKPADVQLKLYGEDETTLVSEATVPGDNQEHVAVLTSPRRGRYLLVVQSGSAGAALAWAENVVITSPATDKLPATASNRWSMYFYVPKGTKVVGGFAGGTGIIRDGDGKIVFGAAEGGPTGYFRVPVVPGQDGRLWQFTDAIGVRTLLSVPPYLAHRPEQLLLPREVVESDSR